MDDCALLLLISSLITLILAIPVFVAGDITLGLVGATPSLHHNTPLYLANLPGLLIVKLVKLVKNDLLLADVKRDRLDLLGHLGQFCGASLKPLEKGGHTIVCRLIGPRHLILALDASLGNKFASVFMASDVIPCSLKSAAYPTATDWSPLANVEMLY